jgi:hypothetical protein
MLAVLVEVPITRPSSHIRIAQLVAIRSAAAAVVQALASDADDLPADGAWRGVCAAAGLVHTVSGLCRRCGNPDMPVPPAPTRERGEPADSRSRG